MISPYEPNIEAKTSSILERLNYLTAYHREHCLQYERICSALFPYQTTPGSLEELPYLPVGLFKSLRLTSVPEDEVYQVLRSSGTTGRHSQIFLDRSTATAQSRALTETMKYWLGERRRPMLIVDSPQVLEGSTRHSARAAAILGMMKFGTDRHWLLTSDHNIDFEGLHEWLQKNQSQPIFIFGFTFMVWRFLIEGLANTEVFSRDSILFHGGGWKRLEEESVSNEVFRERLTSQFGLTSVHDYYGMVEQLGAVWVESSPGVLMPSRYSSVVIRDPKTLEPLEPGQVGLIQVLSTIPESYPGHSILTEDVGLIVENKKDVDRLGRWGLRILGRVPQSPPRGCSDAVTATPGDRL